MENDDISIGLLRSTFPAAILESKMATNMQSIVFSQLRFASFQQTCGKTMVHSSNVINI